VRNTGKPLTGQAFAQKVKELSHLPRREMAKRCGYYSVSKDGQVRVNLTDFYDAVLAAKGVVLEPGEIKDSRGRKPTFRVSVHKNGKIVIGSTYTKMMGLEPGDEFEITLGRKHIHLKQVDSEVDEVESYAPTKKIKFMRQKPSDFKLLGHDCPLGRYPATVVPIGLKNNQLVAVYLDYSESAPSFFTIDKDSVFVSHEGDLKESLFNFDCSKEQLFAISETQVMRYSSSDESSFFKSLLKDDKFSDNDPFFRLSLAKPTGNIEVITAELKKCGQFLMSGKYSINLADSWYEKEKDKLSSLWQDNAKEFPGKEIIFPQKKESQDEYHRSQKMVTQGAVGGDRILSEQGGTNQSYTPVSVADRDIGHGIFPNTLAADVVPATIARFAQLSAEDQLALIWFAYLEMGKTITIAAPGAASMIFAENTLNEIRKMTPLQQTQAMCDLANRADTPICREYAGWSTNIKLGFWYKLRQWIEEGIVAPIPEGYQLSANASAVLRAIQGLEPGLQITVLRNAVVDMGFDLAKLGGSYTRVSEPVVPPKEMSQRTAVKIEGVSNPTVLEYMNNLNANDFDALIALFVPDGALQPPFQKPIVGKDNVLRFFREECQNLKLIPERGVQEPA
jgi:bifunctional DNA-binding transcriptional regulator/antitoxin component of YhaV-PrlF toxin-antitoxin module